MKELINILGELAAVILLIIEPALFITIIF